MKPCADNIVGLQQWKVLMCQELLEEKNSSNMFISFVYAYFGGKFE